MTSVQTDHLDIDKRKTLHGHWRNGVLWRQRGRRSCGELQVKRGRCNRRFLFNVWWEELREVMVERQQQRSDRVQESERVRCSGLVRRILGITSRRGLSLGDAGGDGTKDDDKNDGKTMECFNCGVVRAAIDVVSDVRAQDSVWGGRRRTRWRGERVQGTQGSRVASFAKWIGVYLLNAQSNWMSYFDSGQEDQTAKLVGARYCSKSYAQHPFLIRTKRRTRRWSGLSEVRGRRKN